MPFDQNYFSKAPVQEAQLGNRLFGTTLLGVRGKGV